MSEEEKLAAAPDNLVGHAKGGVSSVKGELVKYYDQAGSLVQVYDLEDSQWRTPERAGIIEFNLEGGGTYEMLRFETLNEALKHIVEDGTFWNDPFIWNNDHFRKGDSELFLDIFKRLPGDPKPAVSRVPVVCDSENFVVLSIIATEGGTIVTYPIDDVKTAPPEVLNTRIPIFLPISSSVVRTDIYNGNYELPKP